MYVDTSVLRQLPADLSSPDLARLNEVVATLGIEKFVPAVVSDEWVWAHQEIARKKRQETLSAVHVLEDYVGGGKGINAQVPDAQALDVEVERARVGRLSAAGFVEIPTPPADVNELLHPAVRLTRPFSAEDRGFRDTMIVRTIMEHAKQLPSQDILIVSGDDVFHHADVRRQLEAVGVVPTVVKTFQQAVGCLEAGLDAAVKDHLDQESARIGAFLRTRQDEIFRLLKEVEVSESFIKGGPLQDSAYYGTLERIRQVRPMEITRVSHGHVLGRRQRRDGQRRPVTFYVKVAFDITVRQIPLSRLLASGPRIRLDAVDQPVQPETFRFDLGDLATMSRDESTDLTVEREIAIEAWVTEDEKTGEFVTLDIEKITTW